jgi:3-hydroxyisobutyrate dehydrogenase-like beta-hydroxyacid dehydrogenase
VTADRSRRIAVLGTGKMGSAVAGRLSGQGLDLILWNRTKARAEELGFGTVVDTPADAASGADVVISSLTGPDAVRAAYLGPAGALAGGRGKLFVEMSTAGPDMVAELSAVVETAGARLVDAPILGAPTLVRDGKAAVLVGGAAPDVALATSVVEFLGTVRPTGPLGSAARLKLVANSMLAAVALAAAELQAAGERSGLDAQDVFWVLERMAPVLGPRRHGYLENRHEPALFAVRDLRKDLRLAMEMFDRVGADTPITRQALGLFERATIASGDMDITAVAIPYRSSSRRAGAVSSGTESL